MRSDSSLFSSLFWWSSSDSQTSSRSLTPSEVKARKVALKCIQVSVALATYTYPNYSHLPPLLLHPPSPLLSILPLLLSSILPLLLSSILPLLSSSIFPLLLPFSSPPLSSPFSFFFLPLLPPSLPPPQDCHPEQLFSESKFLCPEALQELTKALTDATRGHEGSSSSSLDQESAMFLMELLVTVAMENK